MCAKFKFTVPEQFTRGTSQPSIVEATPGNAIPILTQKGTFMATWSGFARIETLKKIWLSKGWKRVIIINGIKFKERDTVSGTKDLKEFSMKPGQDIAAIAKMITGTNKKRYLEVKMITQPADENIKDVHHRMPKILE